MATTHEVPAPKAMNFYVPAPVASAVKEAARKELITKSAYRSDFAAFRVWCLAKGVDALPASPELVAAFWRMKQSMVRRPRP